MIKVENESRFLSVNGCIWRLRQIDERQVLTVAQQFGLPLTIASLLISRGIDVSRIKDFLNPSLKSALPDPSAFKDLDQGVDRIIKALKNKEKIAIFGDYDVDGATSSALLYRYLKEIGGQVMVYIPDRQKEGYGPNTDALLNLAKQGVKLIMTVDCGTTAFDPLEKAKEVNLDVIVIDHHVAEAKLPQTIALINPNRLDEVNNYGHLAAVGVCFILLVGLNRTLRSQGFFHNHSEPNLLNLLDLVALGTVCDVVALTGLNRAFVTQGLKVIGRRQNLGLKMLMDVAGVKETPAGYHLGFMLGPRINAGGRVGKSDLGVTLLTTQDPVEANKISQTLNQLNQERQEIEKKVLQEAFDQAEKQNSPILVCFGKNWHQGVIGIVSGRLKERFYRPALVISIDNQQIGKGSGRSIPGIDLGNLIQLAKHKDLLLSGGGHMMAAGFSLKQEKILEFQEYLENQIIQSKVDMTPYLHIDSHLMIKGATIEFLKSLEKLAPYGQGNATPRFIFENVRIIKADIVGQNHIRCLLTDEGGSSLFATAFRCLDTPLGNLLQSAKGETLHVVGTLKIDSWSGYEKVQMTLEDAMWSHVWKSQKNQLLLN